MSTITTTTVEVLMVLFDVRCVKEYAESDIVNDAADIDDYDMKMTTTMVMTTTMTTVVVVTGGDDDTDEEYTLFLLRDS